MINDSETGLGLVDEASEDKFRNLSQLNSYFNCLCLVNLNSERTADSARDSSYSQADERDSRRN